MRFGDNYWMITLDKKSSEVNFLASLLFST